jgi:broad specificity phosphatase PhoE
VVTIDVVFETHSISVDNERGIASGWLDTPLSARGRDLALRLGDRRRGDGLAAVFASDLARAKETATIAFPGTDIPLHFDARLRECDYGDLEGAPAVSLAPRSRFVSAPYPNGESYRDVVERVASFLHDLREYDGRRVLLVGHSATRWSLEHLIHGTRLESLVDEQATWREGWWYRYSSP